MQFITAFLLLLAGFCALTTRAQGTITFGTNIGFNLQFHAGGTNIVTRHYTHAGPLFGERLYYGLRLVPAGTSGKYFGTERHDVYELDAPRGTFTNVPLERIGPMMAQQGWPMGVGYDSQRNQILLVSLGGEGYIHGYSPATDSWTLVTSMNNWDFDNIEHHRLDDGYYGARNTHFSSPGDRVTLRVSRVNRDGTHGASISIPDLPFGVGFNDHEAEIVSVGEHLALLLEPGRGFYDKGQAKESRIYLIKPATGEVTLTYRKVWQQWPPTNTPPTVQMVALQNGSIFDQGSPIRLAAVANDVDGQILRVEFLANGRSVGHGSGPNAAGQFELIWTPPSGTYSVIARATDASGAKTDSTPISISVRGAASFQLTFYPETGIFVPGGQIFTRSYTSSGPESEGRLLPGMTMVSDGQGFYYGIYWDKVYRVNGSTGVAEKLELPATMEPLSWPLGITFDSKRNRVLVVTIGGEGFLYAYSVATGQWSIVGSMQNHDFDSLLYDPASDQIYAASPTGITKLNASGQALGHIPVRQIADSFGSSTYATMHLGPGGYHSEMVPLGDKIALVLEPVIYNGIGAGMESRIIMIDVAAASSQLTYRKLWTGEPANVPPVSAIISPQGPATVPAGATLRFTAVASDSDGFIQHVEYFANGQELGRAQQRNEPGGGVFFDFNWTPAVAGTYTIEARAIDDSNAVGSSPGVSVQVLPVGHQDDPFELTFYPVQGLSVNPAHVFTRQYTPEGPVQAGTRILPGMKMVADAQGNYYGTHWHRVYKVDGATDTLVELTIPDHLDRDFSWPMGVTFDSKRNRLLVVTVGGEGFLYAYSVATGQWSVVASMDNYDYDSIFYHPGLDEILAYQNGGMHRLSAEGEIIGSVRTPSIDLYVFPGDYNSEMALVDDKIALLFESAAHSGIQAGSESRIYMIDLANGGGELTYRKVWTQVPPNTPPIVRIVSPVDGATYPMGAPVQVRAHASDTNGIVIGINFFANGEKIGSGTRIEGESQWTLNWTPRAGGTYSLFAQAQDDQGSFSDSVPVGIIVGPTEPTENIVGIGAADPEATELSPLVTAVDAARFVISRSGDRSHSITVFYSIHGTAVNGHDYNEIRSSATIPAGESMAEIFIIPRRNFILAGISVAELTETVGIRLEPSPMLNPLPDYQIDPLRREAAAVIYEQQRPAMGALEVAIPGAGFTYQDSVRFLVPAYHPTLDIPTVDYYVDGVKVGSSHVEVDSIATGGYVIHSFDWTGATGGHHVLQAKAVLANGQTLVSSQVPFVVNGPVARPPSAQITHPADGSVHVEHRPIEVRMSAQDVDGEVQRAEILLNGGLLYSLELPSISTVAFSWTNPPAGRHTLTARVTDNSGLIGTSAPVRILVESSEEVSFVTRDLPTAYSAGVPFVVALRATPPAGTRAYAVEDLPPAGWQVSQITHQGTFDPITGKVKFGPFTDPLPRLLTYAVRPPTNATGRAIFGGSSSRDGELYPIAGDTFIETFGPFHPADVDQNNSITLVELTAYAAAWKTGNSRTNAFLRADILTRAGYIWKRGEAYRFNPAAPVPFCWVPLTETNSVFLAQSLPAMSERIVQPWITPGGSTEVQLTVRPPAGSTSFTVEENVPSGWTVANINEGGTFLADSRQIRWGIFLDNQPRDLRFTLIAPDAVTSVANLSGEISFDGQIQKIDGAERLIARSEETDVRLATTRDGSGAVNIELATAAGQSGVVEVSTDLVQWNELQSVYAPDGVVKVVDPAAGDAQIRFYRFRAD